MKSPSMESLQNQAVELLSKLVACPSVNPNRKPLAPYDPANESGQDAMLGEERLARLLEEILKGWGAETRLQSVLPGRPNLIACFKGPPNAPTLLLEAHSDTVSTEGMTIPPFEPAFDGRRLHGRGASDTKGSMASMLLGIRMALDGYGSLPCHVVFVSTCDEELGSLGAHALIQDGFQADAAIVGEPTDLKIIHAHKGALRWRVRTHGIAAHSAQPENGLNAIYRMAAILERIEKEIAPELAFHPHPLLGQATISVGTIQGGSAVNVVPAKCEIMVDRRVLPGERRDAMTQDFTARILDALKGEKATLQCEIDEMDWFPPFAQELDSPLGRLLTASSAAILGGSAYDVVPWASNAGVFHEAGIPTLLFGPGSIKQAHTKDEHIEIEQVVLAARVFSHAIEQASQKIC